MQLPLAHTVTGSANYDLGEHDELALDGLFSTRNQKESPTAWCTATSNAARTLTGLSDRVTTGKGNESSLEGTLGYRHTFAAKGHKLVGRAARHPGPGRRARAASSRAPWRSTERRSAPRRSRTRRRGSTPTRAR